MARIQFHNVTKTYCDRRASVTAVDGLDLEVPDGELLTIVGPSGCGKTTTLRLLAGLEELTAGDIWIGDRVVNRVAPRDRDVAMVFQNYALYPHLSVYDNLAFGLRMRGTSKAEIESSVTRTAQRLSIDSLLHRRPGSLSGGEQQRVALARAIVRRPNVFLFDEPLSNLDVSLRLQMRCEIKTLQRELGITTIHVTHDQEEAMILGHRVAVMKDGKLQQCAPPMEIYEHPANRFVAGFIGSPPMNFLRGRLRSNGPTLCFESALGLLPLPPSQHRPRRPASSDHDAEVLLGIRPERIHIDGGARTAGANGLLVDARRPGSGASEAVSDASGPVASGLGSSRDTSNDARSLWFATQALVILIELLGDRCHVHLKLSTGETLVAKSAAQPEIATGDHVTARLDLAHAHCFDDANAASS